MAPLAETTAFAADILREYHLLALFAVFILEGAMLLYFAPSESLVPAAIVLLGDSTADVVAVIAVAVLGATIGQYALFLVARRVGRDYLVDNRWVRVGDKRLQRFEDWFAKYGPIVVPLSNTLLFTRGMLTIPAGLADMDDRLFIGLSALGTVSFETILALATLGVLDLL